VVINLSDNITNVESLTPNIRFGTTFLDLLYQGRAAKDEAMINKQTGDIAYKRKDDGRIFWYSQENTSFYEFLSQLKSRTEKYGKVKRPTSKSEVYNDSYLMTTLTDAVDWSYPAREDDVSPSLLNGDSLVNPYPESFSIAQEGNGFFIRVNVAPKDRALIHLLNAKYNREYENYSGDDEDHLAKHALYEEFNYSASQLTVNYTVTWYDLDGEIKETKTADGYICINEENFVPFDIDEVYSREEVKYTKLTINSIGAPKLAGAVPLFKTAVEQVLLRTVTDNCAISLETVSTSFFFVSTDEELYLPNWTNHTEVLLLIGLVEYDAALKRAAGTGDCSGGVIMSQDEPSKKDWEDTDLWIEMMRELMDNGNFEYLDSPTTVETIEDELNGIVHVASKLSLDPSELKAFYVRRNGLPDLDPTEGVVTPEDTSSDTTDTGDSSGSESEEKTSELSNNQGESGVDS
jgi:hypothetical protein